MVAKIRDEDNQILFLHQVSIPVRHNAWTELKKYSIICIRNNVVKSEFYGVDRNELRTYSNVRK